MTKARGYGRTPHEFIMREAVSTGQIKRWCEVCGEHVSDQDQSRSKRCIKHRRIRGMRPQEEQQ